MPFLSTRSPDGPRYSLAEALRLGMAPDGGLFLPARIEPLGAGFWSDLPSRSLPGIGADVLHALLGGDAEADGADGADLSRSVLEPLAADALDFEIPLREVAPGRFVLELFHGPTLAFKDVGARFLARLLRATASEAASASRTEVDPRDTTVLVATSGDTGGAVAHAFHGVEGTRVVILYPRGKVSPLQERQLTTLGGNVRAFAVDGVFDDCQRMVKAAFANRELARRHRLTSANSINVGRLLPQAIYYIHAAARLWSSGAWSGEGEAPVFVVPSGNFGNLTAGVLARRLGLDARFVAATNANDVVPEYLRTGIYSPRPSRPTVSNAMDVGDPSNLERLRFLYDDDLEALRHDIRGMAFDDDATRETIAAVDRAHGVVLDPHTAVGWLALGDGPGVVLGTAHPAKFLETVEPAIGRPVPLPEALASLVGRPLDRIDLAPEPSALECALDAPT